MAIVATFMLATVAAGFYLATGSTPMVHVLGVLAAIIPFMLLRDFARRFAFAELRMFTALMLDTSVAAVQIGGLLGLAAAGRLDCLDGLCRAGVQRSTGGRYVAGHSPIKLYISP